MRTSFLFFLLLFASAAFAQLSLQAVDGATGVLVREANALYGAGKYQRALDILAQLEASHLEGELRGIVAFWQGMCQKKLQQYNGAAASFAKASEYGHRAKDSHYEFAQTLFALEKWAEARREFELSLKENFKPAVSLYYLGTVAKELGERNKAIEYLQQVKGTPDAEAKDVQQPADVLIGDLYHEDAKGKAHETQLVERIVVPQYELALSRAPNSELAAVIRQKIRKLKQEHRLAIYELINGKPTTEPRHLLKASLELSQDSNVTFSPAGTTISKSRQASSFAKTDVFGRYTFYYRNFLSLAPGLRFNRTRYFNRVPEIYRNDNQLLSPMLNLSYEHKLLGKPATALVDYDYADTKRDVNSEEKLEFSSRTHTLSLGESFRYFDFGDSTLRLRHRKLESYLATSDSKTTSLIFEQLAKLEQHFFVFMLSYDRTRVNSSVYDTDALLVRADYFGQSWRGLVTPSLGFALTVTDPINDRDNRGVETMLNPSFRLSHSPAHGWRVSAKGDYQKNISKDTDNFAYTKFIYGLELDYIF